ncbi:MAG TPA: hypothetical protein VM915_07610 [Verrucomicrobiae bacterium]|nr:hypothetical protein [Verrucomicrobiae bacterium]
MRKLVVAAIGLALVAGVALAQERPAAPAASQWDATPDGDDFARNYPDAALQRNVQGAVLLCCTANRDRTLSCNVEREWPDAEGFGVASLSVAREFVMSETSYNQMQAAGLITVRRTLVWVLPGSASPESDSALRGARERLRLTNCPLPVVPQ